MWQGASGCSPGLSLTGFILFAFSVAVSGPTALSDWFPYAHWVASQDPCVNAPIAVSWTGWLQALLGCESRAEAVVGAALGTATWISIAVSWTLGRKKGDPTAQYCLAIGALLFTPPQVNDDDSGLQIFSLFTLLTSGVPWAWPVVTFFWLFGFSEPLSSALAFSPLFFLNAAIFPLSLAVFARRASGRPHDHGLGNAAISR